MRDWNKVRFILLFLWFITLFYSFFNIFWNVFRFFTLYFRCLWFSTLLRLDWLNLILNIVALLRLILNLKILSVDLYRPWRRPRLWGIIDRKSIIRILHHWLCSLRYPELLALQVLDKWVFFKYIFSNLNIFSFIRFSLWWTVFYWQFNRCIPINRQNHGSFMLLWDFLRNITWAFNAYLTG